MSRLRPLIVTLLAAHCTLGCRRAEMREEPAPATDAASSRTQGLRFDSEHIELQVTTQHTDVTGLYVLANDEPHDHRIGIFYPFAQGPHQSKPDYVLLNEVTPVFYSAKGAWFSARVPGNGSTSFRVTYRQRHTAKKATYIVTSAAAWGQPIQLAQFVIRYPSEFRNVAVSYPADEIRPSESCVEYLFAIRNFEPHKEVEITWE